MASNLYQERRNYTKGKTELTKVGGLNKSHKTIINQRLNDMQEEKFIKVAELALMRENRANSQRNERRNKR